MNIDPNKQVLPLYQLLCGTIRVTAVFFVGFGLMVLVSSIIRFLINSGLSISGLIDELFEAYLLAQAGACFIIAATLWFGNKRIARWCTPKIDLRCCQICGYDLKDSNTLQCPECGFTETHKTDNP